MALSPDEFWSLTVSEFWIKHRAFTRSENRQLALVLELALRTAEYKDSVREQLKRDINALRQYPEKQWLKSAQALADSMPSNEP